MIANVIPAGSDPLDNIAEPVIRYCQVLGWPSWLAQVFSLLAFWGVALQLSTWVTGPSQMMAEVAKDGLLPAKWHFYRHDAIGVAQNVVITQAVLASLFALLYALPNINSVFLMLVNTAVFIYCTVYGIIGLAFIRVRYLLPNQERPFRVGKNWQRGCLGRHRVVNGWHPDDCLNDPDFYRPIIGGLHVTHHPAFVCYASDH